MALDHAANFVRDSLSAGVDDTTTTFPVEDASIFPDPASTGEYNTVVWEGGRPDQDANAEVVRVTAVDTGTDTLTVTRGQETTTGAAHSGGANIQMSPTAKMFQDIEDRYVAEGEDFDGQGTSSFSGLESVSTVEQSITTSGGFNRQSATYNVVGTSGAVIYSPESPNTTTPNLFLFVAGHIVGDNDPNFVDVVLAQRFGKNTTVISSLENSNPASRTYSFPAEDLQLTMGSDDYRVMAQVVESDPTAYE